LKKNLGEKKYKEFINNIKSNKQSLNVSQDMAYSLFMLGLATPTGANNLERQVLFNMRNTLTKLREFDKKYKPKE